MITPITFLGCPAYIDTHAKMRCGLPAAVTCLYVMNSTDGPLESAMIRCFSGPFQRACRIPIYEQRAYAKDRDQARHAGHPVPASTRSKKIPNGNLAHRARGSRFWQVEAGREAKMNPVMRKPSKRAPRAMCLRRAFLDRMPCPLSVNSVQREAQQRGRTIARMHDHRHPWTSCRDWPIIVRAGRSDPEDHSPHHLGIPGHLGKPPLEEGGCLIPCGASAYLASDSPRGRSYPGTGARQ